MDVFKILAVCLITAVISVLLSQYKKEYAVFAAVGGGIIILIYIIRAIYPAIEFIKTKLYDCGINTEYFKVAVKALGIGYITGFIADVCRDSGQTGLAAKAEFAGKCAIFILTVPLIMSVLETALSFIG